MSNCNDIDKILKRGGTGQIERFIEQLDPSNFELQDFDIEDWMLFTFNFAKHVNYFDTNINEVSGNWQDFFNYFNFTDTTIPFRSSRGYQKDKETIKEVLSAYKEEGKLTPHLTLFICFLMLLEESKTRFNKLTKRHLDFYYKEILQVSKRPATPDNVHVIFELAKKSFQQQIEEGTELNAKKDANGKLRIYTTEEELIANKATVASLKTCYYDTTTEEIKASPVAITLDGEKEPLPEEAPYWFPFGYPSNVNDFITLPDANIGFALASPMFALAEGKRTVTITLEFEEEKVVTDYKLDGFNPSDLKNSIHVYGSGSSEWIGPLKLSTSTKPNEGSRVVNNNKLVLVFQLEKEQDAVVNYNNEILLENYNTSDPLFKFQLNTDTEEATAYGFAFHRALTNRNLTKMTVHVAVEEAKNLLLENDNGKLKANKPFYPFTSQPVQQSNFIVNYPEAFSKKWESITVSFDWKNAPEDFKEWYEAYLKPSKSRGKKSTYLAEIQKSTIDEAHLIVEDETYFTAEKSIYHKEEWKAIEEDQVLFSELLDQETEAFLNYECKFSVTNASGYEPETVEGVKLSLNNTFLHELFPRLYALALTSETDVLIPNEPYTPIGEQITINYTAEETRTVVSQVLPVDETTPLLAANTEEAYLEERIRLYHIHPFGQNEEHNYLKTKLQERDIKDQYDSSIVTSHLVPTYCKGGELYIGLEDAEELQNIALLIQVLEGSENPLAPSFEENEKIQWAILCDDKWKSLDDYIISDNTGKFLTSGIIKFSIPREATKTNTRLPMGYHWVRAKMHKNYDTVCKAINIHAQAVLASFEDHDNELSHLEDGIPPNTIKKLITRIPQVKGITQPYTSFDGKPEESDIDFYRRISERLRHKNRAIALWDYEHMILQQFSEIYKVKCLNHTKVATNEATKDNYVAAGEVTLVVIPDTVNKNVFDSFEPRASKGLLNKIEAYINQYNTMHVTAKVINPNYEKVHVRLEAKYKEGLDEIFYSKQIEEDIIKFLSPWAFDSTKAVTFGVALHKSVLVDYLEKLPYVDYLQNVIIEKEGQAIDGVIAPSNPKSILVSAKTHTISTVLTTCKGIKEKPTITCQ